jgi:hypothetical protein
MTYYRQTQADSTISAVTTTEVQSDYPGTIKNILHLYTHPGARTFCGRKFLKLSENVCIARSDDFFGNKPLRAHEKLCEQCEATDEYEERYALHLLAHVGVE